MTLDRILIGVVRAMIAEADERMSCQGQGQGQGDSRSRTSNVMSD